MSKSARAREACAYENRSAFCSECSSAVASLGWRSMNPGANHVLADRSTMAGVPASDTYAARSCQASGVPNFGDEHTIATRSNRSEEHTSELQSRGHLVC